MNEPDFIPKDQLPILSTSSKKGEMSALRIIKEDLKLAGYPAIETKGVFDQFFEGVKSKLLKAIPDQVHLIVMPSTTGKNTLPLLLAQALQKEKPGIVIHNADFTQIKPLHQLEGKNKGSYLSRLEDPVRFSIDPVLLSALRDVQKKGLPIIASDDIISQSEQFRSLTLQLRSAGIPLSGIVALRASSLEYPKEKALKATFDKIEPHVPKKEKNTFQKDFMEYFGPFPRTKLYRFDQALNELTDWKKVQQVIVVGAANLKSLAEPIKPLPLKNESVEVEQKKVRGLKL